VEMPFIEKVASGWNNYKERGCNIMMAKRSWRKEGWPPPKRRGEQGRPGGGLLLDACS